MTKQNCLDGIPMDEDFENILNGLDFPAEPEGVDKDWEDWDAVVYHQLFGIIPDAFMTLPRSCLDDDMINTPPTPATHKEWQHANSMLSYRIEFQEAQENVLLQTQSPISVLDNRNAISFEFGSKGRRSKRSRSTFNPWLLMLPIPCTTSDAKSGKENKRDSSSPVANSSLFKKCTHCDVTKTPQWREGPLGPKTLCNACGVRYRSGRLLPEYRPAASPTFIPSLHSNSHRKVVEMRRKTVEESPECDSQKFAPLPSYWFDTYFDTYC